MKAQKYFLFFFAFVLILFPRNTIYADENEFEFHVEPIFPKSQIGNKGYYHITAQPNSTVTLQARVINDSDQELTIAIRSLNAYSGSQGIIYQEEPVIEGTEITDERYQFRDATTTPTEEITLGPSGSEVLEFSVAVPDITGTLLGSMEFKVFQKTEEFAGGEDNSQLLIDQYRAINLGVQVDVTDYGETPSVKLEGTPTFSAEQTAILVPIQNTHPVIVPEISGTYEITKQDDAEFSITGNIAALKMAPMSSFYYPIRWTGGTLAPGTYQIASTLDVNGTAQTYEETISIGNEEVEETQEKMEARGQLEIEPDSFPWTMVIIIALLVIVIILLLVMILKSKKQRKE